MITSGPLNVASAYGVPHHESLKVKSHCHVLTVASYPTDKKSLRTRRAVHRLPPSTCPNLLNCGLQTHTIMASKCIFKLARSRLPSASPHSLSHALQVHLQSRSIPAFKCISKLARSQSPIASPNSLVHGLQSPSPNSLDYGPAVYP
jgi:hypothetical protein